MRGAPGRPDLVSWRERRDQNDPLSVVCRKSPSHWERMPCEGTIRLAPTTTQPGHAMTSALVRRPGSRTASRPGLASGWLPGLVVASLLTYLAPRVLTGADTM